MRARHSSWLRNHPYRIYLVAIALAVLPLGFFLVAAHRLFLHQTTERTLTSATNSGRVIGKLIEQHLIEEKTFLQAVALEPGIVRDWQAGKYADVANQLERVYKVRPGFSSIAMFGLDGTLRAVAPAPPLKLGENFSARDWYSGVTRAWKPYVSSVYMSGETPSAPIVAIAVPVFDAAGKPAAILAARETLQQLTAQLYSLTTTPNTTIVYFVDQKRQIFGKESLAKGPRAKATATKDTPASEVKILPAERQNFDRIVPHPGEVPGKLMQIEGDEYLVAFAPIASIDWGVLLEVPTRAIKTALWAYESNLAILGLVIIGLALLGGFIVARLYKRFRSSEDRYLQQIETQNRQLELRNREIEHANQMKSRFLATMSHELRTPLNAILGFASLLQDEPTIPAKQKRWIDHIHEGGRHLLQLINDVLDLSKIEAGRLELHPERFAADSAVPEVTSVLAPLVTAKQIRLHVEVEPDLLIDADRIRFKQVLYNLLSNAVKFTPAEGDVWLEGSRLQERAIFAVRDTGMGIRMEDQELIFQEFHQVVKDDDEVSEGTGLGLAITKRLVAQHGGKLEVRSQFGHGATFTFDLPLAPQAAGVPSLTDLQAG